MELSKEIWGVKVTTIHGKWKILNSEFDERESAEWEDWILTSVLDNLYHIFSQKVYLYPVSDFEKSYTRDKIKPFSKGSGKEGRKKN